MLTLQPGGRCSLPRQEGDAHPPARMGALTLGWDRDAAFPELSSCYVLLLVKEPKVALCLQFTSRATRGLGNQQTGKTLAILSFSIFIQQKDKKLVWPSCKRYQHFLKAEKFKPAFFFRIAHLQSFIVTEKHWFSTSPGKTICAI